MNDLAPNLESLRKWFPPERHATLDSIVQNCNKSLDLPVHEPLKTALSSVDFLAEKPCSWHIEGRHVIIGEGSTTVANGPRILEDAAQAMIPWRKGPFVWHGLELDAEWDSARKWERMKPVWAHLPGRKVLDVGCNNGYYMMRALEHHPAFVLGIDPTPRFYLQWKLLTKGLRNLDADFQLLGIEHLDCLQNCFDVIFCLGVLYHHPNPIWQLQLLKNSLKNGGRIVVEVQGIDDPKDVALFPRQRYAKAPGVWFLPSQNCLVNWLLRAGFRDIEWLDSCKTTPAEQRNTRWCPRPLQTLTDFLDEKNDSLTVEGYPAPHRHMIMARA